MVFKISHETWRDGLKKRDTRHLTREEASTHQRNYTSIKLGEFLLNEDAVHQLDFQIGAHEIYSGEYQLIAKFENRKDSKYVELPYTLTVHSDTLLPAATITSVEETENSEALIQYDFGRNRRNL